MTDSIRVVFFGTPPYAVPALRAAAAMDGVSIPFVVTQPDRPAGRGRRLTAPAVKLAAQDLGLPVVQPVSLRDESIQAQLESVDADVFLVAAYGRIFGKRTLELPRLGCLNLHASILPAYRGAAPISAAILNGDDETGVTLMRMERGLDTGPILAIEQQPITPTDTTESLTARLAEAGARLIENTLVLVARGELKPQPQPDEATLTRPLVKADGQLDPRQNAVELERRVRAMWPWPRAWIEVNGTAVQVHAARAVVRSAGGSVGLLTVEERALYLSTRHGRLRLETVQAPGGTPVTGIEAVRGGQILPGTAVAIPDPPEIPLIRPV